MSSDALVPLGGLTVAAPVETLSQGWTIHYYLVAYGSGALSVVSPREVIGSLPFLHCYAGVLSGVSIVFHIPSVFVRIRHDRPISFLET